MVPWKTSKRLPRVPLYSSNPTASRGTSGSTRMGTPVGIPETVRLELEVE